MPLLDIHSGGLLPLGRQLPAGEIPRRCYRHPTVMVAWVGCPCGTRLRTAATTSVHARQSPFQASDSRAPAFFVAELCAESF